ncbi:MAG: hypothetical protein JKX75_03335 [Gammaproteobacteria bacterium]|nr:hypothetical protein [Gammaproteobacteria bacterium]
MNILYIGSSGALSLLPFKKLQASGFSISAVGVFKPTTLPDKIIAQSYESPQHESLALVASQHGIMLIDLSQPVQHILKKCQQCAIDVILMSCYSKRLPDALINYASKGCFNMHPSLLPRYRGPEPVFWQMKEAADLGVTWHRVIDEFDAGEIMLQKKIIVDEGDSYASINMQLAKTGTQLMLELLTRLTANRSTEKIVGTEQESLIASYYPYPEQRDFVINTQGSARQAYDFMCATQNFGYPYQCTIDGYFFSLQQALDYDNNLTLDTVEVHKNTLYIPFKEGVLIAAYTDKIAI